MMYLAQSLIWYVVIAFIIGAFVGWQTCSQRGGDRS